MKNIITWFSTYQEKMKKRTLRIHRNIEAARLRRARRKRGWHTLIARIVERN